MAIHVSRFPVKSMYPMAPPYIPLLLSSSSLMIWHALIFGAPERVPAGSTASTADSSSYLLSSISPLTVDPMCITCEYLWTFMYCSTSTVPNLLILPRSFLPRSTSMLCSASSFSSAMSPASSLMSSSLVFPLGLVPASGNV